MEDRIHICFVALMFSPSVGGTQARAEKQARQLQALGHDVLLFEGGEHGQYPTATTLRPMVAAVDVRAKNAGLQKHSGPTGGDRSADGRTGFPDV